MHLISVMDDTLDVYEGDEHIGAIASSFDGWAAYDVNAVGRIIEKRFGTYDSIMGACMAIKERRALIES